MGNPRRLVIVFALLLAVSLGAAAQSNETIDRILEQDVATLGAAAYVALNAGDLVSDESTPEKAVEVAIQAGWLEEGSSGGDPAGFGQLAHLLMQVFEVSCTGCSPARDTRPGSSPTRDGPPYGLARQISSPANSCSA